MKITARPNPGRPGFRCTFKDPRSTTVSSFGLGTQDGPEAQRICNDIVTIFSKPALLNDDKNPALLAYHFRAAAIVHGEAAALELFRRKKKPVLAKEDVDTLGARILGVVEEVLGVELPENRKAEALANIDRALEEFESQRYKEVQDRLEDAENRAKAVEPRMIELEAENARMRRQKNADLKESVGDVVKAWKVWFEPDHGRETVRHAFADIDSFVNSLPAGSDFKLRDIGSEHVSNWIDGLTKKGLGATSRRNARAYLSSFFNKFACLDPYKLFENPVDKARAIDGISRSPEQIIAIRRREDIQALLDALKPYPYWRAWVAMAVLCGPRWAEMQWLKIADVFLEEGYFRVTTRDFQGKRIGTKTGKERDVSIERTVAMEIIRQHVETRIAEQQKKKATPAEKSPWLFPSLRPEHSHIKRKHSHIGQWSDNSGWRDQWDDVAFELAVEAHAIKAAKADRDEPDDSGVERAAKRRRRTEKLETLANTAHAFLGHGPAQWRHTFGTVCFACGWTGLEISRAMGNSPDVAEKRYISSHRKTERWEFKWS